MAGFTPLYLQEAAGRYVAPDLILNLVPYGRGNVHQTYLLQARPPRSDLLLQRLHPAVFPQPRLVLTNLKVVGAHLQQRLSGLSLGRRWEVVRLQPTRDGQDWWQDPDGFFWRALNFIPGTRTLEVITTLEQAREVGWALGLFHRLVADLPIKQLTDPLPGFHVTPRYLQEYDRLEPQNRVGGAELRWTREFVAARRGRVRVLEEAKAAGYLQEVPIHGDPKVNNLLWEQDCDLVVAVVDLDTVKPGLLLYDLGDCLRSAANPEGEETRAWEKVRFDLTTARAILTGYLAINPLGPIDRELLPQAVWLIAFELGLRFLTDYLAGNRYFRVQDPEHNLRRALVQFHLAASIETQLEDFRALVRAAG